MDCGTGSAARRLCCHLALASQCKFLLWERFDMLCIGVGYYHGGRLAQPRALSFAFRPNADEPVQWLTVMLMNGKRVFEGTY